ncbi:MAG: hypothetical protein ACREPM_11320 [Gemmatimonadaceae bacterium]
MCAVVQDMKGEGTLPEHIIVMVRRVAIDAGFMAMGDRVLEQVIMWCVDEYYSEQPE